MFPYFPNYLTTRTCPLSTAYMRAVEPRSLVALMMLVSRATRNAATSAWPVGKVG